MAGKRKATKAAAATYPKRSSHFAHKAVRKMIKSCAAQEIGHLAFALVTVIAHTEDAKRYTAPVTYFNDHLMALLAIEKWDTLNRARRRAVEAGWLHYESGGTRRVGRYWVTVPDHAAGLTDLPVDETPDDDTPRTDYPPKGDTIPADYMPERDTKGDTIHADYTRETGIKRVQWGGSNIPYPKPIDPDQARARGHTPLEGHDPVDQKDAPAPPAGGVKPPGKRPRATTARGSGSPGAGPPLAAIRRRADQLFRYMGFDGDRAGKDARLVWQVAALVEARELTEAAAVDAAYGIEAVAARPDNPIGYFRTCLAAGNGDLASLLRKVHLPKGYADAPEGNGQVEEAVAKAIEATKLDAETEKLLDLYRDDE